MVVHFREPCQPLESALEAYGVAGTQEWRKGQEGDPVSTSDPQARVMKHADKGFALSYNAQISTDAAYGLIVGVAVTQEANDSAQLLPAVDRMEQRLERKPQQMVADSGYTTRENIEKMAGREIDFLGTMRQEDVPRGANLKNRFPPSAFLYHQDKDHCVCPEGKILRPQARRQAGAGMIYHLYEARFEDCRTCPRKPECCPDNKKNGRSVAQLEESPVVMARFAKKWPERKCRSAIVVVAESWSFVTHGSRASWDCGSSMCGA